MSYMTPVVQVGFAKVKLATHLLTGMKVAVRVMDKRRVGVGTLPRSQAGNCCHEGALPPEHLQAAAGVGDGDQDLHGVGVLPRGELFDYIVDRDRLCEVESRKFSGRSALLWPTYTRLGTHTGT
eukprot:TRINITY_DN14953_c0_g1_i2.p1 TRINITY_DN14953_c0_g1~~TRINITY_DN14953_c0_g1_i2.p1  ORF type:complete len:124 (-),score=10.95 TRINITY_DN14953_c0_g1_i2:355-726(-)